MRVWLRTRRPLRLLSVAEAEEHPDLEAALAMPTEAIIGAPEQVAEGLESLQRRTGASELMVTGTTAGYPEKLRGLELLARALEPGSIDPSAIRVGTRVKLVPAASGGSAVVLTILGPWDSDPGRGIVSYLAPAVAALLGKRAGEAVRFGDQDFVVEHIEVWR